MYSQYVTRAAARMFVERAARDIRQVPASMPRNVIASDDTAVVARKLVDAIIDRLRRDDTEKSITEESLVEQLANRSTWEATETFVAEVEHRWKRKFKRNYTVWRHAAEHAAALHIVIEVSSYLGTAAVGGIIGNRADATVTALIKAVFGWISKRWRQRRSLSKREAVYAAAASVMALGYKPKPYGPWSLMLESAIDQADGSWVVVIVVQCTMNRCRERFRVGVPAGDPSNASIILFPHTERSSTDCAHRKWKFDVTGQSPVTLINSGGVIFDEDIL